MLDGFYALTSLLASGLYLLVVCLYALFNGLEGLRNGGNPVDVGNVIIYSLLSAAVCAAAWIYESRAAENSLRAHARGIADYQPG